MFNQISKLHEPQNPIYKEMVQQRLGGHSWSQKHQVSEFWINNCPKKNPNRKIAIKSSKQQAKKTMSYKSNKSSNLPDRNS